MCDVRVENDGLCNHLKQCRRKHIIQKGYNRIILIILYKRDTRVVLLNNDICTTDLMRPFGNTLRVAGITCTLGFRVFTA